MTRTRSLLEGLGVEPVLAVDTAPIIYWLEGHPKYADRFAPVFEAAEAGHAHVVVSTVTVAEVLAGPIKVGDELLTSRYREALARSPGWQVVPLDVDMAVEATRIRARYRLRLPDAIQVATAIRAGAAALVTHDRALRRVRGLKILGPE